MKNKQYNVYSARLEDVNIAWLKKEASKFKSPNLFFREIKQIYEKYTNNI